MHNLCGKRDAIILQSYVALHNVQVIWYHLTMTRTYCAFEVETRTYCGFGADSTHILRGGPRGPWGVPTYTVYTEIHRSVKSSVNHLRCYHIRWHTMILQKPIGIIVIIYRATSEMSWHRLWFAYNYERSDITHSMLHLQRSSKILVKLTVSGYLNEHTICKSLYILKWILA